MLDRARGNFGGRGGGPPPRRGSPALRGFGVALAMVGALGLSALGVIYLITDNRALGATAPIFIVFLMLGVMFAWQGQRRLRR